MSISSNPDSSTSPSPSPDWRLHVMRELKRCLSGQISDMDFFLAVGGYDTTYLWMQLVVGHVRDGELLPPAAALNVVDGGSHAEDKLATEEISEDAIKDLCCMFLGSEHRIVLIVAPFYLTIPKDALKVMCKSFGSDYLAMLIEDPYTKIYGDALKVTCKSCMLIRDPIPVVSIVDPLHPKISGDPLKAMCKQKNFETLKHGYVKLPKWYLAYLIIYGNALKVMGGQNIFKEALKDWYYEFFGSKDPTSWIEYPLYPKISSLKLPERYLSYQMIFANALKVMCELNYFGAVIYLRLEYFESEHPIFLIEDPINLGISKDALKVTCGQNIFKEALKDGYYEFFGSKDPTSWIECPFYPDISYLKLPERHSSYQMISADALKVMCELNYFGVVTYLGLEYFKREHPIFLIEDPINPEISRDAVKDLYKSFGNTTPKSCQIGNKFKIGRNNQLVTNLGVLGTDAVYDGAGFRMTIEPY